MTPYRKAIKLVEQAWKDSGASDYCARCIANGNGCCDKPRCNTLGPNGCTDKPLPCALWTCHGIRKYFPKLEMLMYQIQTLVGMRHDYGREFIFPDPNQPPVHGWKDLDKSELVQIQGML